MLRAVTGVAGQLDRRQRRRLETIEEVLDVALGVMAEQGVAGLTLGEVARRVGIRPPSLYVYFASKDALYDALFARGARSVLDAVRGAGREVPEAPASLEQVLLADAEVFVRWALENPVYSQLLFWRPVPGFTPSPAAYGPAVELVDDGRRRLADLQRAGLLRTDVDPADVLRDWTVVTAGIVSQQLSNAPGEPFETGTFTSRLSTVVAMFSRHYRSADPPPARLSRHSPTPRPDA